MITDEEQLERCRNGECGHTLAPHDQADCPKNRQRLYEWVEKITGRKWLKEPLCDGHDSPWDFFLGCFFNRAQSIATLGGRGTYKTMTQAALMVAEACLKPGIDIVHAASARGQSKRCQAFVADYLEHEDIKHEIGIKKLNKEEIQLETGSKIELVSATEKGANSPHSQKLRLDEVELMKESVLEDFYGIPESRDGYKRQISYVSKRKHKQSPFTDKLEEEHIKQYRWCKMDVAQQCPRSRRGNRAVVEIPDPLSSEDKEISIDAYEGCADCSAAYWCRGKMAKADRGWTPVDDIVGQCTDADPATADAQYFCREPKNKGGNPIVRGFQKGKNVRELTPNEGPINLIVDFGGGGAKANEGWTAGLWYQRQGLYIGILGEFVLDGSNPVNDAKQAEQMYRQRFGDHPFGMAMGDAQQPNMINMWSDSTDLFNVEPCQKPKTREDGFSLLYSMFPMNDTIYLLIDPTCEELIEQLDTAKWNEKEMSRARTRWDSVVSTASGSDDFIDALIYLLNNETTPPGMTVDGKRASGQDQDERTGSVHEDDNGSVTIDMEEEKRAKIDQMMNRSRRGFSNQYDYM